jgi:hypothetical protein
MDNLSQLAFPRTENSVRNWSKVAGTKFSIVLPKCNKEAIPILAENQNIAAPYLAWSSQVKGFVEVISQNRESVRIKYSKMVDIYYDTDTYGYLGHILDSDYTAELPEQEFFPLFWEVPDPWNASKFTSATPVIITDELKRDQDIKEKLATIVSDVNKSTVTRFIPLKLCLSRNSAMKTIHLEVDCNSTIEKLKDYIFQAVNTKALLVHFPLKDVNKDAIIAKVPLLPNSTIIASDMAFKVFKRCTKGSSSWSTGTTQWDAITLKAKINLLLCGFTAYTPNSPGVSQLIYKVKSNNVEVFSEKIQISHNPLLCSQRIEFPPYQYVRMNTSEKVVLMQSIDGANTYSGKKFQGTQEEVAFEVSSASENNNGTGLSDGQFEDILYIPI